MEPARKFQCALILNLAMKVKVFARTHRDVRLGIQQFSTKFDIVLTEPEVIVVNVQYRDPFIVPDVRGGRKRGMPYKTVEA